MNRPRILALVLAGAFALCLIGLRGARTQSGLRRVTNTSEEGFNINPSISGDGRILAFESTEDVAQAGGTDHFRAIRANIASDPDTFFQMGRTRAVAPAISQDGSRIAFASKDDPLGANSDGNSEIFLFDGAKLIQVTNTSPGDIANRVTNGNFQPSITDDGRFTAFSSNRDLAAQNSDGNLEIFVYDAIAGNFTQLTNSSGMVGATDAKISGNGTSVAYIRDAGATPGAKRDLLEQPRAGLGPVSVLAANVQSLAMTYGRAISDDGTRVVYSAETATNTTQVFLFDGRFGAAARQITTLGARATEVPLHPTISGDGLRIAFATRRSVSGTTSNSDGSVELYVFDIPSSQVSKITDVPSGVTADVLSSLNDDGSIAAFNFPRVLSGGVSTSDSANNSEIYVTGTPARPPFGALTVLNGASFGKEPSSIKAVAPDSIAAAMGGALANSTQQSQRLPNGTFPTNVGGTTVTVNGRAAQIFFISPGQVNFLVPPKTEIGTADVVVTNSENFASRGTVPILGAAPGVFTKSGDGAGAGVILNSDTLQEGPFDPTNGNLRLTIFSTGARNATQNSVVIGGRVIPAESVIASPDMPGLDEVHVLVPPDLRGAGTVDLSVQSDGRASNPVAVTFIGDANRDLLINEMLSDPPGAAATDVSGDANHDGVRGGSEDEFVELVNTTAHDIDISGYQLLTRSSSTTTDTLRHTFAASTVVPACTAVVVFGGGAFDSSNPVFGGAKVVKASSGDLSLSNTGGVVTLRDQASGILTSLQYGGSTGLNGNASQSLTRAPDKTGNFVLHQTASGSGGRSFSPGTQLNGDPFALCNTFVRIDVSPSSAAVDAGAKQQFTAKAINANGDEVPGVIFSWQSSNPAVATVDQNGLATSSTAGATEIRASARGAQSSPATLTVREVPRVLTRIDVTPQSPTIPATGAQQFTAKGIDQFGNEIVGLTFAWESSNTSAATIDQAGLAEGVAQGQSTIKATSQSVSGTATLNVTAPTVVVNEVLADPPTGTEGDANHDGTRDSGDDEFVELVNSTNSSINISGWTVRTHSTSSTTETVRHTFAANTNFPAGEAMVVFGGGAFNPANPLFGCAQVVKASSNVLSLTNGGLTILVRDGSGNLVTQFSYGGPTGLDGDNDQSLTRSPDVTGSFVQHTTPAGAAGRRFSPGVKLDGTPFGNCTLLTINDVTLNEGDSGPTTFTFVVSLSTPAPAGGVTFDIATQDNSATVANNDYVARSLTGQTIAAGQQTYQFDVTVNGDVSIEPGEAFFTNVTNVSGAIVADGQGVGTISNDDSPVLSINDTSASEGDGGTTTFTFTVSSTLAAPTGGITFDIATADGSATAASGDYVASSLTGQTIPAGQTSYTFDVTVNGDTLVEANETLLVNISNVSANASVSDSQGVGTIGNDDTANLVISQIYAGGGLTGASYTNDFIEVFNRGTTTVDFAVTPYSVQFLSTGGSTWAKTDLALGTLAPGRYFLIKETSGGANGAALPTADATGTINLTSTTAGKVALAAGTTLLTGNCPGDDGTTPFNPVNGTVADFVGYGGTAATANHCYEGSGPASNTLSNNTTADFRKFGGCQDTNDNAADFHVATPNARNTSSPLNDCTSADLGITKTDSPDPVITGSNVTYTIVVTNTGPATATSVVVTDNLPANVTFVSCASTGSGVCGGISNNRTITFTTLAGAASETITLVATANGPAGTPITNTATVSSSTTDPVSGNNSATATTDVNNPTFADLSIVKSDSPDPVFPTATLTYTINVTNSGPDTAQSVVVTDTLPSQVTFVDCSSNQGGVCGGTSTVPTVTFSSLANGVTATITIHVTVNSNVTAATVISNTASVTSLTNDSTPGNNSDSEDTTVQELNAGDLLISEFRTRGPSGTSDEFIELYNPTISTLNIGGLKLIGSNNTGVTATRATITSGVMLGGGCHYLVAFRTLGCSDCYSGAVSPDQTYTTAIADTGGIAITRANGTTIIDQVGMSAGSAYKEGTTLTPLSASVEQSFERKPGGSFGNGTDTNNNSADFQLNASTSNPQNSSSGCIDVSSADLSITKTDSPDPVAAGSDITYTINVTNNGPATASDLTFSDSVPADTTFVSLASPVDWNCTAPSAGGTGAIGCTSSSLALQTATFTLIVKVNPGVAGGTVVSNTATISSTTPDANSLNNSITQNTTVQTSADLSITKLDLSDPVPSGAQLTYSIMVTNHSVDAAQSVTVTDNLPADVTFVSCASSGGTCAGAGNNRTVTFTSIAGSTSDTITLVVRVNHSAAGTTISNTATVASTGTSDPNGTNNSATQTTVVTLPPLVISYLYSGGGVSGSTYTRDFVEIFNKGSVAISLSGLSLQQGATTGNLGNNAGQIYALCPGGSATCTLSPGQYYLVETGTTGSSGVALSTIVTPDDTGGNFSFATANGKGALVTGTTGLACGATLTPCGAAALARIVDLVGYGSGTTQAEGNSPTGNLTTTTAARRKLGGCQDTNINSADFDIVTPTGANAPRNMAFTPLNPCPP